VTFTVKVELENWPGSVVSVVGRSGDVGESPLHAETSVASVAHDATWQAPAQNWRRETNVNAFDIVILVTRGRSCSSNERRQDQGQCKSGTFCESAPACAFLLITKREPDARIL